MKIEIPAEVYAE